MRSLSYTEISQAMHCMAAWDFRYGGRLAGDALKPIEIAPRLSDGRAWGAAVATWHSLHAEEGAFSASLQAVGAMLDSLEEDRQAMAEKGVYVFGVGERIQRLDSIFSHYAQTAEPLPNLTRLEGEIEVPLWGRFGGKSKRYRFRCFIDGWTINYLGHQWIVEFKLRDELQDADLIERSRQPRWYAWAFRELQRQRGLPEEIVGVIVDERKNEAPKAPRIVKGRKRDTMAPSHAKDQLATANDYMQLCYAFGEDPHPEVVEALRNRRWQQRLSIPFRAAELDEAGHELVSAARMIGLLDSGTLYPLRNARPSTCRSCDFRRCCSNPQDRVFVDTLFTRNPPKRER